MTSRGSELARAHVQAHVKQAPAVLIEARRAVCLQCSSLSASGKCLAATCGCSSALRMCARLRAQCPLGRWPKVPVENIADAGILKAEEA